MGTEGELESEPKRCKHYVKRKKRFCKMTVAKGREYCGEHEVCDPDKAADDKSKPGNRISCPLDPKHSVYRFNLKKHLKICNARSKAQPDYVVPDVNNSSDEEDFTEDNRIKLCNVEDAKLNELVQKIEDLYNKYIKDNIEEMISSHDVLKSELENPTYGSETLKHLIQNSSIIGGLKGLEMLQDNTSFVEFGAGKGQVTFWLAQSIRDHSNSNVILVDKASHRHKKDNKLEDRDIVHRIRADIADFEMRSLESVRGTGCVVGVGKHLCGGATDLALRCLIHATQKGENLKPLQVQGFLIAVCCHHRCDWRSFVGKDFFKQHGFDKKDFIIVTKMVSWAICGDGFSRERRKLMSEQKFEEEEQKVEVETTDKNRTNLSRERKAEIGLMCKRVIDYSRLQYMNSRAFECSMKYYVKRDVTLENVCIVGKFSGNSQIGEVREECKSKRRIDSARVFEIVYRAIKSNALPLERLITQREC